MVLYAREERVTKLKKKALLMSRDEHAVSNPHFDVEADKSGAAEPSYVSSTINMETEEESLTETVRIPVYHEPPVFEPFTRRTPAATNDPFKPQPLDRELIVPIPKTTVALSEDAEEEVERGGEEKQEEQTPGRKHSRYESEV